MRDIGHWELYNIEFDEKAFGFVYLITNKSSDRKYIGCKQMLLKTKKQNWKTYTGSSSSLNKDIERLGKENFTFQIIDFAYSKSELKFKELLYQLVNNVMFKDDYYNSMINVRLSKIKGFESIKDLYKFELK